MSSNQTSTGFQGPNLYVDTIILRNRVISGISNTYTDRDETKIPSSLALAIAVDEVRQQIEDITTVSTLISNSLVSDVWNSETIDPIKGWTYTSEYTVVNGQLTASGSTVTSNNKVSVPPGRFFAAGTYYLNITGVTVPCTVTVKLDNTILGQFNTAGSHGFVVRVANQNSTLSFSVDNLNSSDTVVLGSVYLIHVNKTLNDYITDLVALLFDEGGTGYVTVNQLNNAIINLQNQIATAINSHESDLDPHSQYLLRNELTSALTPGVISGFELSKKISDLAPQPILVKTQYLSHRSENLDPFSGVITSTVEPIEPLYNAITAYTPTPDRTTLFSAASGKPIMTYKLPNDRVFSRFYIYVDRPSGVTSYVDTLKVTIGTFVYTFNVTPVRVNFPNQAFTMDVAVPNVTANEITVEVLTLAGSNSGNFAIGFGAQYSDASLITIPTDISFTGCETAGVVNKYTLLSDLSVSTLNTVVGASHPLALKHTGAGFAIEALDQVPSVVDQHTPRVYAYPLESVTFPDNRYGSSTTFGISNINTLYTNTPETSIQASSNNITINHVFPGSFTIKSISFTVNEVLGQITTDSYTIVVNTSTGNLNYTKTGPTYKLTTTQSLDLQKTTFSTGILPDGTLVTGFSIVATTTANRKFNSIVAAFDNLVYDADSGLWSDGAQRVLLGWVEKPSTNRILFNTAITKDFVDLMIPSSTTSTYHIPNPGFKEDVSIDVLKGEGLVLSITPETISVDNYDTKPMVVRVRK